MTSQHSYHLCQFLTKEDIDDNIKNQVKNRVIYYNTYCLFRISYNHNLKSPSFCLFSINNKFPLSIFMSI